MSQSKPQATESATFASGCSNTLSGGLVPTQDIAIAEAMLNWICFVYESAAEQFGAIPVITNDSSYPSDTAAPQQISVGEIVQAWLDGNGFDGLYRPGGCACTTAEISPFDCMRHDCEAGHFAAGAAETADRICGASGHYGSCSVSGRAGTNTAALTDHALKLAAYYKSGMLQEAPTFVPARVKVLNETFGDFPFRGAGVAAGEHDCDCNRWGAVSVKARDGRMLGLRLNEFEPVSWRPNVRAGDQDGNG